VAVLPVAPRGILDQVYRHQSNGQTAKKPRAGAAHEPRDLQEKRPVERHEKHGVEAQIGYRDFLQIHVQDAGVKDDQTGPGARYGLQLIDSSRTQRQETLGGDCARQCDDGVQHAQCEHRQRREQHHAAELLGWRLRGGRARRCVHERPSLTSTLCEDPAKVQQWQRARG
jgi:hypothetical protein